MLIEQAFFHLPEILVGAGYGRQEYEAGIVSAFSLAMLQELNGRNAPNPISFLVAEKRFLEHTTKLRADLHVALGKLYSGTRDYSEFGFRHSNWIEAKFFRLGKGTAPSTTYLGEVVADLIRLVALVPLERAKGPDKKPTALTITGRYFLHAYRGDPLVLLNPKRKEKGGGERAWVKTLLAPGSGKIDNFELTTEKKAFFSHLGTAAVLKDATLEISFTNFKIEPRQPTKKDYYTAILTRLDAGKFAMGGKEFEFNVDRSFRCAPEADFDLLRAEVAAALKPKKKSEKPKKKSEKAAVDAEDA